MMASDVLKYVLREWIGEYVTGLEKAEPGEFTNLVLKTDMINEDLAECQSPLYFKDGRLGALKIQVNWLGTVTFELEKLSFEVGIDAVRAVKNAIGAGSGGEEDVAAKKEEETKKMLVRAYGKQNAKSAFFCPSHDDSSKRMKGIAKTMTCAECGTKLQTNYVDFFCCPPCSQKKKKCMICGEHGHTDEPVKAPGENRGAVVAKTAPTPRPETIDDWAGREVAERIFGKLGDGGWGSSSSSSTRPSSEEEASTQRRPGSQSSGAPYSSASSSSSRPGLFGSENQGPVDGIPASSRSASRGMDAVSSWFSSLLTDNALAKTMLNRGEEQPPAEVSGPGTIGDNIWSSSRENSKTVSTTAIPGMPLTALPAVNDVVNPRSASKKPPNSAGDASNTPEYTSPTRREAGGFGGEVVEFSMASSFEPSPHAIEIDNHVLGLAATRASGWEQSASSSATSDFASSADAYLKNFYSSASSSGSTYDFSATVAPGTGFATTDGFGNVSSSEETYGFGYSIGTSPSSTRMPVSSFAGNYGFGFSTSTPAPPLLEQISNVDSFSETDRASALAEFKGYADAPPISSALGSNDGTQIDTSYAAAISRAVKGSGFSLNGRTSPLPAIEEEGLIPTGGTTAEQDSGGGTSFEASGCDSATGGKMGDTALNYRRSTRAPKANGNGQGTTTAGGQGAGSSRWSWRGSLPGWSRGWSG
mmetsp:Transcript_5023/g.12646  ORF Transcript_5023/g.12646 Transcript_5023/m.12646 type:complete len:702 (-) Transcript_5023:177-2282(-)